jgi:hypothetical protein
MSGKGRMKRFIATSELASPNSPRNEIRQSGVATSPGRSPRAGPKAQEPVRQFFTPALDDYLFSLVRAMEERLMEPDES